MAEEVVAALDVFEQIITRLNMKDIIRCKSVCKSWLSFISSPRFVKYHLNHNIKIDRNNHKLGHRRIFMYEENVWSEDWLTLDFPFIVGSCNGLVCVSPQDAEFLVTNPYTREEKILQPLPNIFGEYLVRQYIIWGFGYDSSSDDYKVIAGLRKRWKGRQSARTIFHVLTLKSNTWKVIGELKYRVMPGLSTGVLCDGALYWLMCSNHGSKKVIISMDLSTENVKKIPQPDVADFDLFDFRLGVIQDCLCLYSYLSPERRWVMKNDKWGLRIRWRQSKYDVAHRLSEVKDSQNTRGYAYSFSHRDRDYDGYTVPCHGDYNCSSTFVKSLVSPHPHIDEGPNKEDNGGVESANTKKRKRNRSKRSHKHKKASGC